VNAVRLVLIGPPGSGKGTQARLLRERLGARHISSGDLLRDAVRRQTPKGLEAKAYMDRGKLVPDALVVSLIEEQLRAIDGQEFLLDGFPRNLEQAQTLAELLDELELPIDHVISLRVPAEEVVRRLSGRRTCSGCGAMFHTAFLPPKKAGRCDHCGGALVQRDDDREETVRSRLEVFARETEPLLDWYRQRGLLRDVDGSGTPEEVFARILHHLHVSG